MHALFCLDPAEGEAARFVCVAVVYVRVARAVIDWAVSTVCPGDVSVRGDVDGGVGSVVARGVKTDTYTDKIIRHA